MCIINTTLNKLLHIFTNLLLHYNNDTNIISYEIFKLPLGSEEPKASAYIMKTPYGKIEVSRNGNIVVELQDICTYVYDIKIIDDALKELNKCNSDDDTGVTTYWQHIRVLRSSGAIDEKQESNAWYYNQMYDDTNVCVIRGPSKVNNKMYGWSNGGKVITLEQFIALNMDILVRTSLKLPE